MASGAPIIATRSRADMQGRARVSAHASAQAKDVPESVLLAVFRANPLTFFTHYESAVSPSLLDAAPELRAFPRKVLAAKLASLVRRGLIDGCACGCRGDWHARTAETEERLRREREQARTRAEQEGREQTERLTYLLSLCRKATRP